MIAQLSPRDRWALAALAVAILAALLFLLVIEPYGDTLAGLDRKIVSRQQQIGEIRALQQEYRRLQAELGSTEQSVERAGEFSLFTFLETTISRVASRDRLIYIRPQAAANLDEFREESVEIKLERIRLDQLVRLLYEVESSEAFLQVKTLRVKTRFDDKSLLDATLTIAAYRRAS